MEEAKHSESWPGRKVAVYFRDVLSPLLIVLLCARKTSFRGESLCGFFAALELLLRSLPRCIATPRSEGRRVLRVLAVCRAREASVGSAGWRTCLTLLASWRAMQWLVAAGLQPSAHGAKKRAGPEEANCSHRKIPLTRRLGVREPEGLAGSDLERRGWLARNVLVTLLDFGLSVHFPLRTGSDTEPGICFLGMISIHVPSRGVLF